MKPCRHLQRNLLKLEEKPVEDVQDSLEFTTDVMKASDTGSNLHSEAKEIAASAMKRLAKQSINFPQRNYYLTFTNELDPNLVMAVPKDSKHIVIEASKVREITSRLQNRFMV